MQYCSLQHWTSITSPIHNWVLLLLWIHLFILSGVISPLIYIAYWAPTNLRSSSLSVLSFCLFIPFRGFSRHSLKKYLLRTSLVVQWWRIHLPVQGTWVWSLVWEDPTCYGATKPMCHDYLARARAPQWEKPTREQPPLPAARESLPAAMKTQGSQK